MVKFTLFFLSLSLLIILHEFGHYITARWFKARVDKFYLFFDFLFPFGNIMKFSLFKKKVGATEYGIGWFPFGGYVDIAGMMADPEKPNEEPKPDEFRAKKPYQRLIILAGGITVNFLLGIIIYSMLAWGYGEKVLPVANATYGFAMDSVMLESGFRNGDKLVSVDNTPIQNFEEIKAALVIDDAKTAIVERQGQKVEIVLPEKFATSIIEAESFIIEPYYPFVIDSVEKGTPAASAGILKGDSLITLNGDTLNYFINFVQAFQNFKEKEVTVGLYRNGEWKEIKLTLSAQATMGVHRRDKDKLLTLDQKEYGFFAAWGRGWTRTIDQLGNYIKQLRFIFSKEGASKVGGFGSIASIFPSEWNWIAFWEITAMLSIILAFMNLLPIPVLDGGYILFVLWEMITRKKVSEKFMQRALSIGMYLVLALLVLANGNDIYRFLIK